MTEKIVAIHRTQLCRLYGIVTGALSGQSDGGLATYQLAMRDALADQDRPRPNVHGAGHEPLGGPHRNEWQVRAKGHGQHRRAQPGMLAECSRTGVPQGASCGDYVRERRGNSARFY